MEKIKVTTPRFFEIESIGECLLAFLDFYNKTAVLGYGSTGENHGIKPKELLKRFAKLPEWHKRYAINWHNELESIKQERDLLVQNNSDLKDKVSQLELANQELLKL